jgi:DNA (cytosine-5)-methyltransferase 1
MDMNVLDLFSGIGGFSLGLHRSGMNTVQFVEKDPYCRQILEKNFPGVPIHDDIRTFKYDKPVQLICGGFPCQPFSQAGLRRGKDDDRHLWPQMARIIQEVRPRWVIGENVSGIINLELDEVLATLEGENYQCQTLVIPACAVNAPHRRDRVWIVAHTVSNSERPTYRERTFWASDNKQNNWDKIWDDFRNRCETMAHSESIRIQGGRPSGEQKPKTYGGEKLSMRGGSRENTDFWAVEPKLGRVANGIPRRVDRLKALGNAVVPQIVEIIGKAVMEIEKNNG